MKIIFVCTILWILQHSTALPLNKDGGSYVKFPPRVKREIENVYYNEDGISEEELEIDDEEEIDNEAEIEEEYGAKQEDVPEGNVELEYNNKDHLYVDNDGQKEDMDDDEDQYEIGKEEAVNQYYEGDAEKRATVIP